MKDFSISFTSTADESIEDIGFYISQDNPKRAMSFVDEIYDFTYKYLTVAPFIGRELFCDGDILRVILFHKNYNIYISIDRQKSIVYIHDVIHSKRSTKTVLNKLREVSE